MNVGRVGWDEGEGRSFLNSEFELLESMGMKLK